MENRVPIRFFVITFLWSWALLGIIIFIRQGNSQEVMFPSSGIEYVLVFFGALGPAVGAIISIYTIEGKNSFKKFIKSFFSLKFGWKVWLLIFLILGISSITAWIIPEFFGEERLQTYLPSVYIFPIYILMMVFYGGGQEEIGWRGYISPYLEKKFGLITGGLILGIIWALWHLPLFFISGSSQSYMNFFVFMLMCIGYSYLFSWIVKKSDDHLFSGLVVHGVANSFAALFPFIIMVNGAKQIRFFIYSVLMLFIGIIIVIIRTYKKMKTF